MNDWHNNWNDTTQVTLTVNNEYITNNKTVINTKTKIKPTRKHSWQYKPLPKLKTSVIDTGA